MPVLTATDEEIRLFRRLINLVRTGRINVSNSGKPSRLHQRISDHPSPETYIARPVEEDGIPALEEGPTAGTSSDDIAGYAMCNVFQLFHRAGGEPLLLPITGFPVKVYNVSRGPIQKDWFLVTRAKNGRWLAIVSGVPSFKVRVTARFTDGGIGYYDWFQVLDQVGFPAMPSGRTGTYVDGTAAIEVNGGNRAIELTQMVIEIHPLPSSSQGETGTATGSATETIAGARYWFDDSIPPIPANPLVL